MGGHSQGGACCSDTKHSSSVCDDIAISSFNYGAGKKDRVRKAFRYALIGAEAVLTILSVPIFIFAGPLVKQLRNDPQVIELGIRALRLMCVGHLFVPLSMMIEMGFAGASFLPDESQPQEKVEGKTSTLELSDVTAYNKITATEKGTIEGTTLKDYTYKIGETEIAPVAGVSIPQFYSIKLNRTFKPNQWTTLTLPFNLTEEEVQSIFGAGTQLIQLNKGTIILYH